MTSGAANDLFGDSAAAVDAKTCELNPISGLGKWAGNDEWSG